jgi:hypothetical protein
MREIHLFSSAKIKSELAGGKIVRGFSSQPGKIDNNKLVITMNPNDLRAKPFAVVNYLMNTLGGKNITLTSKQNTEVIVVAFHNKATTDAALDGFRKKVEVICSDFNDFIRHNMQLGGNVSAIDKILIMPQVVLLIGLIKKILVMKIILNYFQIYKAKKLFSATKKTMILLMKIILKVLMVQLSTVKRK